jgi:geranylgeranyl pyrophosphate synthase
VTLSLDQYRERFDRVMNLALTNNQVPDRLQDAMRYSALSNGKRVRALLVYAAGFAVNAPIERLDAVACALECIHSYSLIHDDLPAMDNDDLRRGQATNHIQFDEATAILAGDALLTLAFELINAPNSQLTDAQCRLISHKLAIGAGQIGMVGGQTLDILATAQLSSPEQLKDMHLRKTGALINAAVSCGALCAENLNADVLKRLSDFADNIGLAFQVIDDVLDVESNTEQLGKRSKADLALQKSTYPKVLGLEASKQLAQTLYQDAIASIDGIGDNTQHLTELATLVVTRKH